MTLRKETINKFHESRQNFLKEQEKMKARMEEPPKVKKWTYVFGGFLLAWSMNEMMFYYLAGDLFYTALYSLITGANTVALLTHGFMFFSMKKNKELHDILQVSGEMVQEATEVAKLIISDQKHVISHLEKQLSEKNQG